MEDVSKALAEGMEVYTADGTRLGKIDQVWYGSSVGGAASAAEETCIEVKHHHGLFRRETLYLPCHLVQQVDDQRVTLSADMATVQETPSLHRKPAWFE